MSRDLRNYSEKQLDERRERSRKAIDGELEVLESIAEERARRKFASGRIEPELAAPPHGAASAE